MNDKKSYYAIIPAGVRYNEDLCANAKLLYGEITALCNQEGFCWATNKYFAELYNVSEKSISKWISQLDSFGYVRNVVTRNEGGTGRKIYLNGWQEIAEEGRTKVQAGVEQKVKYNNTVNNTSNTTINKDAETSSAFKKCMAEYFSFFENKTKFKPKITGADGKALKSILTYFKQYSGERSEEELFIAMLNNWDKLDNFLQKQLSLTKINHFLNDIINQLKNGKEPNSLQTDLGNYAKELTTKR